MPDGSRPSLDLSVNLGNVLLATGMIVGGVIAWTTVRERAVANTDRIMQLAQDMGEQTTETNSLENRVLVLEGTMTYQSTQLIGFDKKIDNLTTQFTQASRDLNQLKATADAIYRLTRNNEDDIPPHRQEP